MLLRRPTVRDARGTPVPLIRHEVIVPGMIKDDRYNRLERAGRQLKLSRSEKLRFAGWSLVSLPVVVALGVLAPTLLDTTNWWTLLYFVPGAFVPAVLTIWISRRALAQRIADTYARAALCASCGYDLADLPPDNTGCRTCPECGAAWKAHPPV